MAAAYVAAVAGGSPLDEVVVDADRLRKLFNDARFNERCLDGELTEWTVEDGDPDPRAGEPPGTRSQIVDYLDRGHRVARIHQYLRADGSLGGSGLPDPKRSSSWKA